MRMIVLGLAVIGCSGGPGDMTPSSSEVATSVVSDHKGDFLAIDATVLVNVAHCQLRPTLQLLSEGGVLRGHRGNTHGTDDCDPDLSSQATRS